MKHARVPQGPSFVAKFSVFVVISLIWLLLDRASKLWANTTNPGTVLIDDIAGLFDFRLVHNTGAAWGILSNSTFILGIFSAVVCLIILIFTFTYFRTHGSVVQIILLALVFAGGLGNAIDRLSYGYVVDFINAKFIDFPVFNVADIGVTCGIILLLLSLFFYDTRVFSA